jgi:hypothetical protein
MKIGNIYIGRTSEKMLKSLRLLRLLGEAKVDDLLAGKSHVRKNPARKEKEVKDGNKDWTSR